MNQLKDKINNLYEFYKNHGNDRRFQQRCVRDLQPITDIFCRKARIDEEDEGELMSYLWAGYFYAFENYKNMKKISLWTAIYGISNKRMLDYIRKKKRQNDKYVQCGTVQQSEENEEKDNTMNELLTKRLLTEAGIVGLDYEIFVRKRGLFGYREHADKEIIQLFGIRNATLRKANRRNANRLYDYKKKNTEDI